MVRLREMMRSELRGSDLSTEQRRNIADYLPNRTDEEIRRQLNGEVPLHNVDSRQVDRSEVGRRLEIELMKQKSIHAGNKYDFTKRGMIYQHHYNAILDLKVL